MANSNVAASKYSGLRRFLTVAGVTSLVLVGGLWSSSDAATAVPFPVCKQGLAPDTEVLMADGTQKDIEDISVGDVVWSADPEVGSESAQKVTAVHEASAETLSVSRGSDTIVTSPGHMFWNESGSEWVDSSDLSASDKLLTDRGTVLTVAGGSVSAEERPVIDLTVSRNHTFFVSLGAENVLVHNCGSLALQLGYVRTSFVSMGKPVYQRNTAPKSAPKYIVEDRTSHNGGYWKGASKPEYLASKTTRQGTYDANLKRIAD